MDSNTLFHRIRLRNNPFFNHWFNKRFNEEPSPLEVEIFNYQQDLDNYLSHKENSLNVREPSN